MKNTRSRREVENSLERKGFKKSNKDHKRYIYHNVSGKKTSVHTKTSHGSGYKEITIENLKKWQSNVS